MTRTKIKKLSEKLLLVFGNLELVEKAKFYGSLAKGKEDKFSDLDLEILVSDSRILTTSATL